MTLAPSQRQTVPSHLTLSLVQPWAAEAEVGGGEVRLNPAAAPWHCSTAAQLQCG